MRTGALVFLLIFFAPPTLAKKLKDFKVWHNSVFLYHPTGPDISSFRASWIVPAAPTVRNGQDIAIWMGLEPEDSKVVLQPVLQTGTGWANGGSTDWSLACWAAKIATDSEVTFKSSKLSTVRQGDKVTAVVELISRKNGTYIYKCYFEGYPETELIFEAPSKLNTAWLEYEIQDVTSCEDYSDNVTFTGIRVMAGELNLPGEWQKIPLEDPKNCGMKIKTSKKGGPVTIGVK
jgi:hypothetical protein